MAWLRIEDGFHDDPDIDRLGNEVAGAFVRCCSYCADNFTDGFIRKQRALLIAKAGVFTQLERIGWVEKVKAGDERVVTDRRDSGRRHLPDVAITMPEDGYFIPKYLHYNPTRSEVKERRQKRMNPQEACTTVRTTVRTSESTPAVSLPDPTRPVPEILKGVEHAAGNGRVETPALNKLLEAVGPVDEDALSKLRGYDRRLPEGVIAKVAESVRFGRPRSRVAFALGALRRELETKGTQ